MRRFSTRNKMLAIGLLIVCCVIVAFGIMSFNKKNSPPTVQDTVNTTKRVDLRQQASRAETDESYAAAKKSYEDASNGESDKIVKAQLLTDLATLSAKRQKYDDAYSAALQAESVNPTVATSDLLGYLAGQKGDKAAATEWFKKSIERLNTSSPTYKIDVEDRNRSIKEIGGSA